MLGKRWILNNVVTRDLWIFQPYPGLQSEAFDETILRSRISLLPKNYIAARQNIKDAFFCCFNNSQQIFIILRQDIWSGENGRGEPIPDNGKGCRQMMMMILCYSNQDDYVRIL